MGKGNYSDDEISLKQIIMTFIKKNMDLSLMIVSEEARANKMKSYRESVLCLSDILLPFYDEKMNTAYDNYEKNLEESKKKVTDSNGRINDQFTWLSDNERIYRKLFRDLNLLLSRNDYLKSTMFGETEKDEVVKED